MLSLAQLTVAAAQVNPCDYSLVTETITLNALPPSALRGCFGLLACVDRLLYRNTLGEGDWGRPSMCCSQRDCKARLKAWVASSSSHRLVCCAVSTSPAA
ncbi:hypothetical protein KIL84_022957 [Mauremys mutica]|uniref:Uncharacterized protein n=1 Tax=Mauremys mutica TaxID=74926 RepID=A0A9D3WQC7_9SAUR|nr:hypothetical protein KIL84_022957 [Mauremys mutica]